MDVLSTPPRPESLQPEPAAPQHDEVFVFPASYAQRRLWFLDRLQPGNPAYNLSAALRLSGRLQVGVFRETLAALVARHESLRTTFAMIDGEPVQVIDPAAGAEMPLVDLAALGDAEREAELARLHRAEPLQPFDLARGPLLRTVLVRLADREHAVFFNLHHIVGDGWSMGVLVREVGALYAAFARGLPSPLPELPLQYADFAQAQREWLRGEVLAEQLAFWRRELAGFSPLELPADRPRPQAPSSRGGSRATLLPADLSRGLAQLSRRQGTTLFVTLLAALQTLLHRYTGSEDIGVGTAVAGRNHLDTEEMIGFFVNTLVMRARLAGTLSFVDLLARVNATAVGAYTHQDVPFEMLVDELHPVRDFSRTPFLDVMLVLQNTPPAALELPGLTLSAIPGEGATARFDWSVSAVETPEGLEVQLDYSADRFDGATIERALGHWRCLLTGIVDAPGGPFFALPLMTAGERSQVLEQNRGELLDPPPFTVDELFARQAASAPQTVALVAGEVVWTYRELHRRASGLARRLRRLGVGPEAPVAVLLDRSPEALTALLGILASGGCFVPLDPSHPRERLEFLLRDSGAVAVILSERHRQALPAEHPPAVLIAEGDGEEAAEVRADEPSATGPLPRSLAYVIYTSGSTGTPKGVMVEHRSLVNYFSWVERALPTVPLLALTRLSFDAFLKQTLAPLTRGGEVWLAPVGIEEDPAALLRLLGSRRGVGLNCVPSLWRVLLERLETGDSTLPAGSLTALLLGGETISSDLLERTRAAMPELQVWNLYGPTEATANATGARLEGHGRATLGEPVTSSRLYLLDRLLQPVPPGIPGELHIAGIALARGYRGRPDLTAERFIPSPFGAAPGERLYRTGDLARSLPAGGLEFLGRVDQQVKIRGFRIEPGEVEGVLAGHPDLTEAAVAVHPDPAGEPRLVAYVVFQKGASHSPAGLREFLDERLPAYLVPAAFVSLEALPRTAGHKIDRAALAPPGAPLAGADRAQEAEPPRSLTEDLLAGIWADLLAVDVGVHDNFFALGGHSLLAIRLLSRVREALGVEVPPRELFDRPTVAGLARAVDRLKQRQGGPQTPPLEPVSRRGALPLSFAQQRLWVLDQLTPGLTAYNLLLPVRLEGRLDAGALERALHEIVRRHEALRTRFEVVAGSPVQRIEPAAPFALPRVDLRGLPPAEREAETERLAAREAARSFDLGRAPLLRATLLQLAAAVEAPEHVLLLTVHHIAADGWSLEVLSREVTALYDAFTAGSPSPLPELPIQYGDYSVWQRGVLQGEQLASRLSHWRERLAGSVTLALPGDRPRPEVQSFRGGQVPLPCDPATATALQELARGRDATLFIVMLAAFQTLLHRLSGQEDVVVGVPSANRDRREIEGLIGFFINMLPLRTRLAGPLSFLELLARVREAALDGFAHRDLPFERLVEELQPERTPGLHPVFQVTLQVVRGAEPVAVRDLVLRRLALPVESARFDLNLGFLEAEGEIGGALEYGSDLFDRTTAERWAGHLGVLLAAVAADPGRSLETLPLLTPAERRQLAAWNDTSRPFPREACVQDLFALVAERHAGAVAVEFGEESLSYGELDRRATGLANHLRRLGVGPEVLVGVCLERSPAFVVALLGILKAGGAYLPLDPSYPPERLALMLADAGARALVTREDLRGRLPAAGLTTLCLESLDLEAPAAREVAARGATAQNLAYVIYTSGSTGRPKGVAVPHRAIVRLVMETDYVPLRPTDRMAQASNVSFDAATFEIWGALLNGACLVGVTRDVILEPREFAVQLRERRISALFLTTALFNQLAREAPGAFASLRHLLFGGEAVDPAWVRKVLRQDPPERLLHVYGPTESTTFTSWHRVETLAPGARTVPIGQPIANTRIALLDGGFAAVPVGVIGEVYIGGDGLARGYLGRPELTAERFVPSPDERGERLYRTGDLARRRWPEGDLEFVGRTDHQVKVRGFRIEPGEVQAALDTHPGVRESYVLAREDGGDHRLVAYVVPRTGLPPEAAELREFLLARLPDYMVPAAFVSLAALPLTPNRKIDRAALPAPALADAARRAAEEANRPPTPTEEILLSLWEDLFASHGIGLHDDFFALGGHSLLAIQLISRVREIFAAEVPLRALFDQPTVAGFAAEVEAVLRSGEELAMPPLVPAGRDEPLPLSFAQQRLWLLDQMEVGLIAYNVPMAVHLEGVLHWEALRRGLEAIVHRHEALRTSFEWMDGNPVQVILPPEPLALPTVDLQALPAAARGPEVSRLAREEAVGPFDLEVDRLFRLTLLRLGAREHVLLVTLHHIVSDGWSMGVLLQELSAHYGAFLAGRPSLLPELALQYGDYAVWQRRWLQGETLERQLAWWRGALADLPALDLPTDRPYRPVHTFAGGVRSALVPRQAVEALAALCRHEKVTLFMALLTAWAGLLQRTTGQPRVAVGSPVANRNRLEIESLIGFFVNTLVLSTDLGGDPTGRVALQRVREVTLGAFAHQDMPFQRLVEELQPQRSLQRSPLFQAFFSLQNSPRPAAALPGLALSMLPVDSGTAKFELSLGFVETAAGAIATVEYNQDLFDATTAERLLGQFLHLLAGLVAEPERPLSELPVLSEPQRQQVVVEWNDTRRGEIAGTAIHRLFEAEAAASPAAPALLAGEARISYGELNRRANRLARYLQRLGVGLEVPVGICLDSSPDLILCYLAVLKAGGVYVPLGTAYPADRLAFMLAETGAPVVLTREGLAPALPRSAARVVAVDADPEPFAAEEEANLPGAAGGTVSPTSSTPRARRGAPKGSPARMKGWSAWCGRAGGSTSRTRPSCRSRPPPSTSRPSRSGGRCSTAAASPS